jgi:hypothetical protein
MADTTHADCVKAWLDRAPRDLTPEQRVWAFEQAFGALWQRARMTLGEVTLTAIADRVLQDARERFPALASVRIGDDGIACEELRAHAGSLDGDDLMNAARAVLVEFLTVLGNLTAELLSPALHAALSSVPGWIERGAPDGPAAPSASDDEGAAS